MLTQANILDPVHATLAESVFDDAASAEPKLKPQHRRWIISHVTRILEDHGYTHIKSWLTLVLTGSLTTYQYGDESDCDVSLFVNAEKFPEWSRAEVIGIMISKVDGTMLPGTHYPMQCFVVPPGITREDLYKPGLRSGYDLETDSWIEPPDRSRVHDVEREYNDLYIYALEQADKMERLLRYEPNKAKLLWHQIHLRRQRDQKAGKGDFSGSNIVYKFLANRGLFPAISDATGEYIAKQAAPYQKTVTKFIYDPVLNHLVLGKTGPAEGAVESHQDLVTRSGLDPKNLTFGQFDPYGRVEVFGRPRVRGFDKQEMTQYESQYRLKQALEHAVPGVHVESIVPSHNNWDNAGEPQISYMGESPTVNPDASNQPPTEKGTWEF